MAWEHFLHWLVAVPSQSKITLNLTFSGYLFWEYPTNLLLQRFPLSKYLSFCIILWGATLACFAAVQNFAGGVAIRFILGVCEASVTPGFALLTSQVSLQESNA